VGQGHEAGDVIRGYVEAWDLVASDPGITGCRYDLGRLGAAQQRPDERVLATAGSDNENLLQVRETR
jgi:hypothetical protein